MEAYEVLKAPDLSLSQQIRALGIPEVGRKKSEWLAKKGKNWSPILNADKDQIRHWLKMSSIEAQTVISYLNHSEVMAAIEYMNP